VITSNKQKAAISIAIACKLIRRLNHTLSRPARAQVWVITGDKQETAINIAIACNLIRRPDSLLLCNAKSRDEAAARLDTLLAELKAHYAPLDPERHTRGAGGVPLGAFDSSPPACVLLSLGADARAGCGACMQGAARGKLVTGGGALGAGQQWEPAPEQWA
jgi:hypothetical protein